MGSMCTKQSKGKPNSVKNMGGNNSKVFKNGPPCKASKPPVVKALYDFNGMNDGDLAFKKGDRMTILDKSDPDWWKAKKWDDQTTGFIPSNFVAEDKMTVEAQEWWFDMDRRSASVQLKCLTNDLGAFVVRKTKDNKTYAMSILVSRDVNTKNIKHFRIKEESGKYFLTKSITFGDVIRLVEYYKLNPVPGDKYCLGKPCTREEKNVPFRSIEVDRKSIELMEKLGDGMFGKVVKVNPVPRDKYCLGKPCTREEKNVPFRSLEVDRKSIELMEKLGDGMFRKVVKGDVSMGSYQSLKWTQFEEVMSGTKFDTAEIEKLYRIFMKEFPKGEISRYEFITKYSRNEDATDFTDHLFRTYDTDGDGTISFKEFLTSVSVASKGNAEEQLMWAFKMYDVDQSGEISYDELIEILTALLKAKGQENPKQKAISSARIIMQLDLDKNGALSLQEFVSGALKNPEVYDLLRGRVKK